MSHFKFYSAEFRNTAFQKSNIEKNNIIDLGTNSNGFGTGNTLNSVGKRFKAVCEKALKDGIISGFISADVAGEGAMHIEIIQ
ncbi:hypothetical protein [Acinetobacter junii]|uniref:hypothetical protein n=1 Tax=Acinetobacter junii TaxID=40215 RepID=UPI001D0D90FC|nr:hypothetical protein [Acinetobacter junii]